MVIIYIVSERIELTNIINIDYYNRGRIG